MPSLVLLNGPPAVGKSTLAAMHVEHRPLALNLDVDVDVVRGQLGRWLDDPFETGVLARKLALAMAVEALRADKDVVVPQFLARPASSTSWPTWPTGATARSSRWRSWTTRSARSSGSGTRSMTSSVPTHRDAAALLEVTGGLDELARMYDRLGELLEQRPQTLFVDSIPDDPTATYERLVAVLP